MSSAFPDGKNDSTEQPEDEEDTVVHGGPSKRANNGSASEEAEVTPGAIQVRFTGLTAVGLVREHNEDNLVNANLTTGKLYPRGESCEDVIGPRGCVFAVCDGMGGAAAGEVASQMAVDMIFNALRDGEPPTDRDELARKLVTAVEQAGKRIFETAQSDQSRRGMGTTVTAAVLLDKVLFLAQVGDSRAYLLRNGEVKQLTKDQSLVSQLIEAGHLTEAEAESFEHSNIILQALGTAQTVQVDLTFVELRANDRLMLCSDGLSGMVDAALLHQTLRESEESKGCCERLIELANEGGGHDNITVIVVDFFGEGLAPATVGESFGYMQYPLPPPQSVGAVPVPSKVSAPSKPARAEPYDDYEEPATRRAPHMWIVVGVTALLAAAAALVVVKPKSEVESTKTIARHQLKPARQKVPGVEVTSKSEATRPAPSEYQPVKVRIRTEVENALLLVNGEPRGPISAGDTVTIELAPGAYRFEAQSGGSIAAAAVKTVKPDTPLEIALNLPSGAGSVSPASLIDSPSGQGAEGSQKSARVGEMREISAKKKASASAPRAAKTGSPSAEEPEETSSSALKKEPKDTALSAEKNAPETRVAPAKAMDARSESGTIGKAAAQPPSSLSEKTAKTSEIPDNPF